MKAVFVSMVLLAFAGVLSILILGCTEIGDDDVEPPSVGSGQVGFINNTSITLSWGIRYEDGSKWVNPGSTSTLPYSDNGYWITGIGMEAAGIITISAGPGQTIEAYETGGTIRAKIR